MCGWDSSCDACAILWDYALADDSCFPLLAFCVVALMSMRHVITTGSPNDVQAAVNAFSLKDEATTLQAPLPILSTLLDCVMADNNVQLVERCRCLVDATPEAIKFTVDRVWKAADSASSGQVLQLPCGLCCVMSSVTHHPCKHALLMVFTLTFPQVLLPVRVLSGALPCPLLPPQQQSLV
jgi:hypothetical protein